MDYLLYLQSQKYYNMTQKEIPAPKIPASTTPNIYHDEMNYYVPPNAIIDSTENIYQDGMNIRNRPKWTLT